MLCGQFFAKFQRGSTENDRFGTGKPLGGRERTKTREGIAGFLSAAPKLRAENPRDCDEYAHRRRIYILELSSHC